jgi:hypothetical protein
VVPPKLQCSCCIVTQKPFNAGYADIPTAVSVFSSEVVFKDACTRNFPADEFLFLRTVHHLLFLFNAIFGYKKNAPYPGAINIAIPPKLMIPLHAPMHQDHYLKIFNADSADIPTAISVFSSEVVFNDACTRNLPACGFPFLRTVHHLLFLFNAVMFFIMIVSYQKVFLMSMIFVK